MAQGIFPTKDSERDEYYKRTIPYINTNKVRLTVPDPTADAVMDLLTTWNTTYPLSKNPDTRTKTLTDEKDQLIVEIEDALRAIYDDIPVSVLTDADRNTLNLKRRDTTPTPRPALDVTPFVKANSRNGALIEFICRTDSDSSRASRLRDADGIELVYNVGGTQPVSPSECTKNFFSTKAKFKVTLDISDAGKKLQGYMRWKNNSDPAKSGPWTQLISASISD